MSKLQIEQREGTFANAFSEKLRRPQRIQWLLRSHVGTDNAIIRRARVPKELMFGVQKSMRLRFRNKPKIYVYLPRKGTQFREKEYKKGRSGVFLGLSSLVTNKKQKPLDSIILIPKAYEQNEKLRDIVIRHEMVELLAGQHGIKPPGGHQLAVQYDEKGYRKMGIKTRKEFIKQLIDAYNAKRNWEPFLKRTG
jgi:hypothetical protein